SIWIDGRYSRACTTRALMCNCTSENPSIVGLKSQMDSGLALYAPRNDKKKNKGSTNMSDVSAVKALVFDVFGTVVDWRSSLINDFTKWSETSGIQADWTALVDGWRAVYFASMD